LLKKIFNKLLKQYGKQNWWPAETEYEIVVGIILTQNTTWKNVEKALSNLKRAHMLEPKKILSCSNQIIEQLIKPCGFYKQKTVYLKNITRYYVDLDRNKSTATLRKELLNIKGIGKESADSFLLYVLNRPSFVIDAYTKRFVKTFKLCECKTYEEFKHFFESNLPSDVELYKEFHALIVRWGKEN